MKTNFKFIILILLFLSFSVFPKEKKYEKKWIKAYTLQKNAASFEEANPENAIKIYKKAIAAYADILKTYPKLNKKQVRYLLKICKEKIQRLETKIFLRYKKFDRKKLIRQLRKKDAKIQKWSKMIVSLGENLKITQKKLKSLEKEAELKIASNKTFLELTLKLKKLELELRASKKEKNRKNEMSQVDPLKNNKKTNQQIIILNREIDRLKISLLKMGKKSRDFQKISLKKENYLKKTKGELLILQNQKETLQEKNFLAEKNIKKLNSQIQDFVKNKIENKGKNTFFQKKIEELEKSLQKEKKLNKNLRSSTLEKENFLKKEQKKSIVILKNKEEKRRDRDAQIIKNLNNQIIKVVAQNKENNKEIVEFKNLINQLKISLKKNDEKNKTLQNLIKEKKKDFQEKEQRLIGLQKDQKNLEKKRKKHDAAMIKILNNQIQTFVEKKKEKNKEVFQLKNTIDELEKSLSKKTEKTVELGNIRKEKEKAFVKLNNQLNHLEKKEKDFEEQGAAKDIFIKKLNSQIEVFLQEKKEKDKKTLFLTNRINDLTKSFDEKEKKNKELGNRLEEKDENLQEMRERLMTLQKNQKLLEGKKDDKNAAMIKNLNNQIQAFVEKNKEKNKHLKFLQNKISKLEISFQQITEKNQKQHNRMEEKEKNYQGMKEQLIGLQKNQKLLEEKRNDKDVEIIKNLNNEIENLGKNNQKKTKQLEIHISKLKTSLLKKDEHFQDVQKNILSKEKNIETLQKQLAFFLGNTQHAKEKQEKEKIIVAKLENQVKNLENENKTFLKNENKLLQINEHIQGKVTKLEKRLNVLNRRLVDAQIASQDEHEHSVKENLLLKKKITTLTEALNKNSKNKFVLKKDPSDDLKNKKNLKQKKIEELRKKAFSYEKQSDLENAKIYYLKIIKLDKYDSKANFKMARLYLKLKNYKQALLYLDKVFLNKSNNQKLLNILGNAYLNQQKYRMAISLFSRSLAIDEKNSQAWLGLGFTYQSLNNNIRAKKMLEKAFEIDSLNANIAYNISAIILSIEPVQMRIAKKWYDKALSLGFKKNDALESHFKKYLKMDK